MRGGCWGQPSGLAGRTGPAGQPGLPACQQGVTGMAAKIVEDTAGLVSIGQLAKAAGVSSRTIRYYEELGILPEPRRSPGGTRKYPHEYRGYIDTALALQNLGFPLEEIKPRAKLALAPRA